MTSLRSKVEELSERKVVSQEDSGTEIKVERGCQEDSIGRQFIDAEGSTDDPQMLRS